MGILDSSENKITNKDDLSYIEEVRQLHGPWEQYDFLLSGGYGWDYILDCAEYMIQADLQNIGTISASNIKGEQCEYIDEFKACGNTIKGLEALKNETSVLGLGGISRTIRNPVKIVWFNQTRVLRIFSIIDDEDLMTRYAETIIRRTFDTDDSMASYKRAVTK